MKLKATKVAWDTVELYFSPETDAECDIVRIMAGNEKWSAHLHLDGTITLCGEGD